MRYVRGLSASSFFDYDGSLARAGGPARPELLPDATEADWDVLLSYCETLRFRPGETVFDPSRTDRALYILADGELDGVSAPAVLGEAEFFTGRPHAKGLRAETDGELLRLSFEAFEAMAARDPRLARDLLVDLGRRLALRLP
jgi:CRP-like cAMP-binding protein